MPAPEVNYIRLWDPALEEITCCLCGQPDEHRWGIPVDSETALVVANDFQGDWGCKPACRHCYAKHEKGAFVGTYPKY